MKTILKNQIKECLMAILLFFFLGSCTPERIILSHVQTIPLYPINPAPSQFLVLSTYDVPAQDFRERKEKLFMNLLDTMLSQVTQAASDRCVVYSDVIFGITKTGNRDSTVRALMKEHHASHAIVITFFNVYFEQTKVEVTKDSTGKTREAFYDIVSVINYSMYDEKGVFKDLTMKDRRFHSSRFVLSGLLAIGPDIVANRSDALDMASIRPEKYLDNFFPGWADRRRTLFVGKGLKTVGAAIDVGDYDTAMKESLRLVNDSD